MNLLPFDLNKALAGAKVVTRDGQKVKELFRFGSLSAHQKIFAIVDRTINRFSDSGKYYYDHDNRESPLDLFLAAPEPTYIPFTQATFPLDGVLKHKSTGGTIRYVIVCFDGIWVFSSSQVRFKFVDWQELLDGYEITTNIAGKTVSTATWLPCGVATS